MIYILITIVSLTFAFLAYKYEILLARNEKILKTYNEQLEKELKKRTSELTEQKKQLEDSEFRWKFAIDGSGNGLWDWNVKTNEVYFSKGWKEMLGFKDNEIKGSLDEWQKRVHPDDIDNVFKDINAHINKHTDIYINEHRVMCKDGTYKWIQDRGLVVQRDENGNALRLLGTHSDISSRKETEFKMKQALTVYENTNEGIMITNADNMIINVNPAFCNVTGYTLEEVLGKDPSILKSNTKDENFYKDMWKDIKEKGYWQGEITNKNKKGILYDEFLSINTVRNIDGTINSYIGIFSDISLLKQQEKMILQQARTSAIGEMIGNIAHQWRQPLSAISTVATGMKLHLQMGTDISKEEEIENLDKINEQTQHLSKTIDDFRGFFSEDMTDLVEFEVSEAINKVHELVKDSFRINFVEIIYDIDNELFINSSIVKYL
jgi:PAS domain S-box-containing protein